MSREKTYTEKNEIVGLEVKDDVDTELNHNVQVFYQIKHTTVNTVQKAQLFAEI